DLRLDFNNPLVQKIASAEGQPASGPAVLQFVSVHGDGADIYVRPSDGLPESVKGTLNATVDVTSPVRLLGLPGSSSPLGDLSGAGGKLGVSVGEDLQFTDWGS